MIRLRPDLLRMANQIAANFAYLEAESAAPAVAAHLRHFWSPLMRAELVQGAGDAGLSPLARAAAELLAAPAAGG